jgi:hypothetical protein
MQRLPVLILGVAIAGCAELPTEPSTVPFATLWTNRHSEILEQRGELISTQERWQAAWSEIVAFHPEPAPPDVDFGRNQVVIVASGRNPDTCWKVNIESIELSGDELRVLAKETRPPFSCVCPPDESQPVHVVRIPKLATSADFEFRQSIEGAGCR